MEKALEEIQKAERCIKKCIDIISDGDELEGLDFPSQNSFYEEMEDDIYKIKRFGDLCWNYDREVDKPFADSYERLLEKVSQIKTEDIRIKNNIGITEKEIYFINSSTVGERDKIKEEISFEDVLGYGEIGKLIKANYEIYLEQVGSETGYITLDDYISSMVKAGEFNYKIIPEWQEYLSLAIDCVPIIGDGKGILESIIGVDLITGRELSSLERGLSLLSAIPLMGDYAVIVKGAQKVVVKEVAESSIKGLTGVGLKKYAIKEGSKYALKAFNKELLINSLTMVGSNALTGFGVSPVACLFLYQGGRITLKNWKKFKEVFGNTKGAAEAKSIPGQGYHKEVYANKPVKVQDAVNKWDEFLGAGEYNNIHPRTGLPDADRIFSADGKRRIRFRSHEMNSKPSKFHYHEETWTHDPINNVMNVDNTVVRVPHK